jgi:hypothetical protein
MLQRLLVEHNVPHMKSKHHKRELPMPMWMSNGLQ